jgi:hypothetical protein
MNESSSSRFLAMSVALCHFLFVTFAVVPSAAYAQSNDVDPPVIELERVDEGTLGDKQVFAVTATDNLSVTAVTLHYRFSDADEFKSVPMQQIPSTDIYTASVETRGVATAALQYYIEALDAGSNRSIQGFAFDPLVRQLIDRDGVATATAPAQQPTVEQPVGGVSTGRKVLYGVLGLVLVGALASAASSSGDDAPTVPLNIVVEDPL